VIDNLRGEAAQELIYAGEGGERLDTVVVHMLTSLSRTRVQTLIERGDILVNGHRAKASQKLAPGDVLLVKAAPNEQAGVLINKPVPPLDLLFEDEQILVVNKPTGIVVHPAPGHTGGTLLDVLLARDPTLIRAVHPDGGQRPGIVHRLDKDTSGILIVAKTPEALAHLAQQFQARTVIKRYLALVEGHLPVAEGAIEAPIGRDQRRRQRMTITAQHGRHAHTFFWVEREFSRFTLVRTQIVTGRTHQIRVHFAAIGHPVAGDRVYGRPQSPEPPRLFLHAAELHLTHPATGQKLEFRAALPSDLEDFLKTLS